MFSGIRSAWLAAQIYRMIWICGSLLLPVVLVVMFAALEELYSSFMLLMHRARCWQDFLVATFFLVMHRDAFDKLNSSCVCGRLFWSMGVYRRLRIKDQNV